MTRSLTLMGVLMIWLAAGAAEVAEPSWETGTTVAAEAKNPI